MKKLLNKLKNLFKKKIQEENMEILIIEDSDEGLLHVALGITNERAIELNKLVISTYNESEELTVNGKQMNVLKALQELSKQCKHRNELTFSCIRMGKYMQALDSTIFTQITK